MRHLAPARLGNRAYRGGGSVYLFLSFTINLIASASSTAFLGQERPRITGRNYILLKNIQPLMPKSHFKLLFILMQ